MTIELSPHLLEPINGFFSAAGQLIHNPKVTEPIPDFDRIRSMESGRIVPAYRGGDSALGKAGMVSSTPPLQRTMTWAPESAASIAVAKPAAPLPTTKTSERNRAKRRIGALKCSTGLEAEKEWTWEPMNQEF